MDRSPRRRPLPSAAPPVAAQRADNKHVRDGVDEESFVKTRSEREAMLGMPRLLLPSVQVNIRARALPPPEQNGVRYLKLPLGARWRATLCAVSCPLVSVTP